MLHTHTQFIQSSLANICFICILGFPTLEAYGNQMGSIQSPAVDPAPQTYWTRISNDGVQQSVPFSNSSLNSDAIQIQKIPVQSTGKRDKWPLLKCFQLWKLLPHRRHFSLLKENQLSVELNSLSFCPLILYRINEHPHSQDRWDDKAQWLLPLGSAVTLSSANHFHPLCHNGQQYSKIIWSHFLSFWPELETQANPVRVYLQDF